MEQLYLEFNKKGLEKKLDLLLKIAKEKNGYMEEAFIEFADGYIKGEMDLPVFLQAIHVSMTISGGMPNSIVRYQELLKSILKVKEYMINNNKDLDKIVNIYELLIYIYDTMYNFDEMIKISKELLEIDNKNKVALLHLVGQGESIDYAKNLIDNHFSPKIESAIILHNSLCYEADECINSIQLLHIKSMLLYVKNKNPNIIIDEKSFIDEIEKLSTEEHKELFKDIDKIDDLYKNANFSEIINEILNPYKDGIEKLSKEEMKEIENNLTFIGMVGMIDPPREEAKKAVEKCKTAGIKTVMITGDHKITATAIAKKLGILEKEEEAITGLDLEKMTDEELAKNVRKYSVYARVSPEHKVRIVKAWQKNGEIVAMTGDGVNDSPALKTANIGCAMGIVGTDVAKEAADVILTDDNFATIVSAVEEGRRIYDNILKVIQFLLSSNVGEIVVLFLATLFTPLFAKWFGITNITKLEILLPVHILWINLVTDSLPALALAFDPANSDIMQRKPEKPGKGIFTKGMSWRVIYQGAMIGLLTLIAFMIGLGTTTEPINGLTLDESKIEVGQTMAFVTLALSELVHVFNIRDNKKSIFKTNIFNNSKLILAIIASAALMIVILAIPGLRNVFSIPVLPTKNIVELVILIFAPLVIVEIFKLFKINTTKDE